MVESCHGTATCSTGQTSPADDEEVKPSTSATEKPPIPELPAWQRWLFSLLILWHLAAVFLPPWSMPPAARLTTVPRDVFGWYVQAMYLDHGYRFFAPDPGEESHLVRYDLKFADGREEKNLVFPSRNEQWPRLWYHRYFMLAEFLNTISPPPPPPEGPPRPTDPEGLKAVEHDQQVFDSYCESYARHLLRISGATEIKLYKRRHRIPPPTAVANGQVTLTSKETYKDEFLGRWQVDE